LGTLNLTLRRVAEENAIPLVDVEPTFRDSLRTAPKERYFVPDGHCNDKGYAIVAEAVGRKVLELRKAAAPRS
jgi:lysophospholipase L1-like esterase